MDGLPALTLRVLFLLTACGCQNFLVAAEGNVSNLVSNDLNAEGNDKTAENTNGPNGASGNNTERVSSLEVSGEQSTVGSTLGPSSQVSETSSALGDSSGDGVIPPSGQDTDSASAARALNAEKAVTDIVSALSDGASDSTNNAQSTESVSAALGGASSPASVGGLDDTHIALTDESTESVSAASDGATERASIGDDLAPQNVTAPGDRASHSANVGNDNSTQSVSEPSDVASGSAGISSESASNSALPDARDSQNGGSVHVPGSGAADDKGGANVPDGQSADGSTRLGDNSNGSMPDGQSGASTGVRSDQFTDAAALDSAQTADVSTEPSGLSTTMASGELGDSSSSTAPEKASSSELGARSAEEGEESWEVLDPSSEEALARAKKRSFSRIFLMTYERFVSTGRAKEIMPDPFFERDEPEPEPVEESQRFGSSRRGMHAKEVKPTDACNFMEGHDFIGHDVKAIADSNKHDCCRACFRSNKIRPGSCGAAVLSSETDSPPNACWLKNDIQAHTKKPGVVACIPKNSNVVSQFPDLVV